MDCHSTSSYITPNIIIFLCLMFAHKNQFVSYSMTMSNLCTLTLFTTNESRYVSYRLSVLSVVCHLKTNVEYTMHYMRSSGTLILRIYHQYKYWCRYCNLTSSQVNELKASKVVNPKVVIWFSRALTWRKTTYRELTTWYSPHMFYYIQTTSWCYNFNVLFCRRQQNNCR